MSNGEGSNESQIQRHYERLPDDFLAPHEPGLVDAVTRHVENFIGPIESVFHELVSSYVHVDVHWVKATADRPMHVLVTSGMSSRPMTTPAGLEEFRRAELLICLPDWWQISEIAFQDERNYWPLRWLKSLARLPHEYGTWLGAGHTVPNGDPPSPLADEIGLAGFILIPPLSVPEETHQLHLEQGELVWFWTLLPLYREEMDLKLKRGSDVLLERLDAAGVTDVVDPHRKNVALKTGWWPF